jgi:dienelactone hydrolase
MASGRLADLSLLLTLVAAAAAGAQDLPRGQVVPDVKCLADASQSYALYLPSTYSPDKAWPLLMGFHPGARGIAIVEKYRAAAEKYGYIVAASNNSRNGPWDVSERAVGAMTRDLAARFTTDQKRLYTTGHSGGARVAMQIALTNPVAGVIASSAGYPDSVARSRLKFVVFGTAGDTDFNYIEMKMLDRALKTPHRVVIFEGGHTLPPDSLAMEAIEWLELQAIKSGIRTRDEDLVLTLWHKRLSVALKEADPVKTVALMQGLTEDFKGLHDTKKEEDVVKLLLKEDATKRALDRQRSADQHEMQTIDDVARYEAGLRDETRRSESFFSLQQLLQSLLKKAQSELDSPERDSARRVLRVVTMNAAERTGDKNYLALLEKYKLFTTGR